MVLGLSGDKKNFADEFSRFGTIPVRDRQTDRRTVDIRDIRDHLSIANAELMHNIARVKTLRKLS